MVMKGVFLFSVVRFEDLAANPAKIFHSLMSELKLSVTEHGLNYIRSHTVKDRFKEVRTKESFTLNSVCYRFRNGLLRF